jgi:hypothetical protein
LSADTPAPGTTEDSTGQNTSPPLAGTDSIFEDNDNEDQDDDDNNNDDNDDD